MRFLKVKTITAGITSITHSQRPKYRRWLLQVLAVALTLVIAIWVNGDISQHLSADTRVVVRLPRSVFAELTQSSIREEFSILEQSKDMEVTGNAVATGQVSIDVEPEMLYSLPAHAVFAVRVVGETEKSLVGRQSGVQILGTGHGTFEAVKRIHFDGRGFRADDATQVVADHETEIDEVETTVGGPFRLLAARKAQQAIPLVNEIAVERIKERVGERVDELVEETLEKLNLHGRLDEMIARMHPTTLDDWRISVSATDRLIQAALVPGGGAIPQLPATVSEEIEVWVRLTPSQRFGINVLNRWKQAHRLLLGGIVTDEQAQRLARELSISDHAGWTRVRLAAGPIDVATT